MNQSAGQEDTFKILIATDVHLGHRQNDPILANDSFQAFGEVLSYAKKQKCDFLLLGGDLFDVVNPSITTLFKCMSLLRQVVFSNQDIKIEVISDYKANYTSQNLNVGLPIFSTHGNHDFPQSNVSLSVMDLMHQSNYINYFGKVKSHEQIVTIKPILMRKGRSVLALYGVGYIDSFRLSKLFAEKAIRFERPAPQFSEAYCLLVVHQNRFKGKHMGCDYDTCLHPQLLPDWIHLIIWCHEHQSIPKIETREGTIPVYQPGSTIITQFIEAEMAMKHCGMLQIVSRKNLSGINLKPLFLAKSHRPLIVSSIDAKQLEKRCQEMKDRKFNLFNQLISFTQKLLSQEQRREKEYPQNKKKPIVRVKVEYTGFEMPDHAKLEHTFEKRVANPSKIFKFAKKRAGRSEVENPQAENMLQITNEEMIKKIKNKETIFQNNQNDSNIMSRMYMGGNNQQLRDLGSVGGCFQNFMLKAGGIRVEDMDEHINKMITDAKNELVDEMKKQIIRQSVNTQRVGHLNIQEMLKVLSFNEDGEGESMLLNIKLASQTADTEPVIATKSAGTDKSTIYPVNPKSFLLQKIEEKQTQREHPKNKQETKKVQLSIPASSQFSDSSQESSQHIFSRKSPIPKSATSEHKSSDWDCFDDQKCCEKPGGETLTEKTQGEFRTIIDLVEAENSKQKQSKTFTKKVASMAAPAVRSIQSYVQERKRDKEPVNQNSTIEMEEAPKRRSKSKSKNRSFI